MKKRRTTQIGEIFAIGIIGILLCSGMTSVSACSTELYAGRDLKIVGDVHVWSSGELFYIQYSTDSGWTLSETNLAVATSLDGIPQTKKGNPKIGQFPFSSNHPAGTETVTYVINLYDYFPVGGLSGKTLFIAAHAVVSHPDLGEETAWADTWGQSFPGGSWALYFTITF